MKKMRLELERLEVESFVTGTEGGKGTVRGHESTEGTYCTCETAPSDAACVETGEGGYSCGGTYPCWTYQNTCFNTACQTCGRIGGVGCNNTAYPCQSYNACPTDVDTCNSAGYRRGC